MGASKAFWSEMRGHHKALTENAADRRKKGGALQAREAWLYTRDNWLDDAADEPHGERRTLAWWKGATVLGGAAMCGMLCVTTVPWSKREAVNQDAPLVNREDVFVYFIRPLGGQLAIRAEVADLRERAPDAPQGMEEIARRAHTLRIPAFDDYRQLLQELAIGVSGEYRK